MPLVPFICYWTWFVGIHKHVAHGTSKLMQGHSRSQRSFISPPGSLFCIAGDKDTSDQQGFPSQVPGPTC